MRVLKKETGIWKLIEKYSNTNSNNLEEEKKKTEELFNETSDIISSIKFGEVGISYISTLSNLQ